MSGLDYTPRPEDCTGLQVVSDFAPMGTFSCSNEKLNTLQEVHLRTIRNYNVQMPQDPVREKACWTQDVQTNFEPIAFRHRNDEHIDELRNLEEENMSLSVTNLAYGAKGLWYFCYWGPHRWDDKGWDTKSIVDSATGEPTALYHQVRQLNETVLALFG